jgi:uncharacterized protein (DUF849 family)
MEKLIITVAPTRSVPRKEDTTYIPVTPDEIAETAYLCEQEGASVIHVHCRDETESPRFLQVLSVPLFLCNARFLASYSRAQILF